MKPLARTAVARSRFGTPGSTQTRRSSGRISRTRSIFVVTITSASRSGVEPPASPVPLPRGTTESPWRAAARTHATTSSVERGNTTSPALPSTIEASRAYSFRASGSESTSDAPSASMSSRRAASTSGTLVGYARDGIVAGAPDRSSRGLKDDLEPTRPVDELPERPGSLRERHARDPSRGVERPRGQQLHRSSEVRFVPRVRARDRDLLAQHREEVDGSRGRAEPHLVDATTDLHGPHAHPPA